MNFSDIEASRQSDNDNIALQNAADGSVYAGRTFVFSVDPSNTFLIVGYSWTHRGNIKEDPTGAVTCTFRLESTDLKAAEQTGWMIDSRINTAASPTVVAQLNQWLNQRV